jgi:hypothetical protein
MLLKIGKRLAGDGYTGELTSWCIWNKDQNKFTKKLNVNKQIMDSRLHSVLTTGES